MRKSTLLIVSLLLIITIPLIPAITLGEMDQFDLFRIWAWIFLLGFTLIAIRQGWVRKLFEGRSSPFVGRTPPEIDLAWEVRRIRQILQWIQFTTALIGLNALLFFWGRFEIWIK